MTTYRGMVISRRDEPVGPEIVDMVRGVVLRAHEDGGRCLSCLHTPGDCPVLRDHASQGRSHGD